MDDDALSCLRIFHADGHGHGKAVISSYLIANQETARAAALLSLPPR